jgi:hypothetical protein
MMFGSILGWIWPGFVAFAAANVKNTSPYHCAATIAEPVGAATTSTFTTKSYAQGSTSKQSPGSGNNRKKYM